MTPTRWTRWLALLACAAVAATSVGYDITLQQQGSELGGASVTPWQALQGAPTWVLALLAAGLAATAVSTALRPSRRRRLLLIGTATMLFGLGFVAIFSIGAGLLLAAALCLGAASADRASRATSVQGQPPRALRQ